MATGFSINIGVDQVSPRLGFPGLSGCENDATDMNALARSLGFRAGTPILGSQAKLAVVTKAIENAARTLIKEDILLLTFSGHGASIPDIDFGEERDQHDETWVLYDDQLIDDALYERLVMFASGVRILVLSDSCHSGTVIAKLANPNGSRLNNGGFLDKLSARAQARARFQASEGGAGVESAQPKTPPYLDLLAEYFRNRDYYDDLIGKSRAAPRPELHASVILLSACRDGEIAASAVNGARNGRFTTGVLSTWANGSFPGKYQQFRDAIATVTNGQTPNLFPLGPNTSAFLDQRPFTI